MNRTLQPGQRCEVWIASVTGERELVYSTDSVLLEAPNWTLDGASLILNGDGKLWRFAVADNSLSKVHIQGVPDLNNDHVLAPDGSNEYSADGKWIYLNTESFTSRPGHAQPARVRTDGTRFAHVAYPLVGSDTQPHTAKD